MSIRTFLEQILAVVFPLRRESKYFYEWTTQDYLQRLPGAGTIPDGTIALFSYKHKDVRTLIRSIKKEKVTTIRDSLAELLTDEILASYTDSAITTRTKTYIVPIPLSKKSFQQRGFNQSGWIACRVAENLGSNFIYAPHLLRKIRETKKQALLHRNERLKNQIGSYKAGNVPPHAHILLIDDVVTTGATVTEAKKVLKQAGAGSVEICCVAH